MLHTCSPGCRHDPALKRPRGPELTIDLHCHVITPQVEALPEVGARKQAERQLQRRLSGEASALHNENVMGPPATRRMLSMDERLADMDAMGVDIQVLSPSPTQYYYWADESLAARICDQQNDHIAALCDAHPDRLRGLGTVALQHPELAVAQLHHTVERLGLQGVEISSVAGSLELFDPALEPFWDAASKLQCTVFLHPLGTSLGERVAQFYLGNIIGQPLETTIALSKMIFAGVFERHPGIRMVAAHGGGFLPSYVGRSDHGAQVRPEAQDNISKPPSDYLKNLWFDTVVYDPLVLRHLMDTVGADRVVVGTDYPYDMGAYDVHEFIASVPRITSRERAMLLGLNAAALLQLQGDPRRR